MSWHFWSTLPQAEHSLSWWHITIHLHNISETSSYQIELINEVVLTLSFGVGVGGRKKNKLGIGLSLVKSY